MRSRTWQWGMVLALCSGAATAGQSVAADPDPTPEQVQSGLRQFFARTARADGSFAPGVDPAYRGMSDSAYSDLAAVTYAVTLHKTFGWKLPHEAATRAFLLARQRENGSFFNVAGTVDPDSPEGQTYNTTQALVALSALGTAPRRDPLPIFEAILKQDYKSLPAYSTSFFPLAYLCAGKPIPDSADRGIRALMVQDETGYTNDHIAATFHASHYYHLVGETTPKAHEMVERILRDQKPDGGWLLNMPSRDRHATFDAVFTLHHEGGEREDCRRAIARAAQWALSCRNADGGFGHFPGSPSDADANYFQVGTLVMAGFLSPAQPLPENARLLSWGHLMPRREAGRKPAAWRLGGWVGSVAFSPNGAQLACGAADGAVSLHDAASGRESARFAAHSDAVAAVAFAPDGATLASAGYDQAARLWRSAEGPSQTPRTLAGHRGGVLCLAFRDGNTLASGGIDGTIRCWDAAAGRPLQTLEGHRSWVNALRFTPDGKRLVSGSSDGTIRIWLAESWRLERTIDATPAEVRSLACSPDGRWLAAGIRYGEIGVWELATGRLEKRFRGHESDVWALDFHGPDQLVSGNGDWNRPGQVKLWEIPTGRRLRSWQHTGEVLSLDVSPDGRRLAAGGGDKLVHVWATE